MPRCFIIVSSIRTVCKTGDFCGEKPLERFGQTGHSIGLIRSFGMPFVFLFIISFLKICLFIKKFTKKLLTNGINMRIIRTMSVFLPVAKMQKVKIS